MLLCISKWGSAIAVEYISEIRIQFNQGCLCVLGLWVRVGRGALISSGDDLHWSVASCCSPSQGAVELYILFHLLWQAAHVSGETK